MSSTYGENLKLSIFGQSHGAAIGMTLDGIPAGLPVDLEALQVFLNRRAPGQNDWSTPRKEEDRPEFLSGVLNGFTCGAPIAAIIRNNNTRSGDYENLKDCPRPGHADFTAQVKYGGFQLHVLTISSDRARSRRHSRSMSSAAKMPETTAAPQRAI